MSVCETNPSSCPLRITKENVAAVFNKDSKYTRFKSLESGDHEAIASVCNDILQKAEDRVDYWAIKFEAKDLNHEFEIFSILFRDVLKVTFNLNLSIIEGVLRKKNEENVERPAVINHLLKLLVEDISTDVTLKVNGGAIKAHKIILNQRPLFYESFAATLEKSLEKYNYKVVYPCIEHLYGAELNLQDMDIPSYIEMIEVINVLGKGTGDKTDKAAVLNALSKKVTDSNYDPLVHAIYQDSDLKEFTTQKLSEFMSNEKIDFSQLPLDTLTKIYLLVKGCKSKESLICEIGKKLKFDQDFIKLCENADKDLRKGIKKGLEANDKALFNDLKTNKDKLSHKKHWEAYSNMMSEIL